MTAIPTARLFPLPMRTLDAENACGRWFFSLMICALEIFIAFHYGSVSSSTFHSRVFVFPLPLRFPLAAPSTHRAYAVHDPTQVHNASTPQHAHFLPNHPLP